MPILGAGSLPSPVDPIALHAERPLRKLRSDLGDLGDLGEDLGEFGELDLPPPGAKPSRTAVPER
jgi:hypothetical protein